MANKLNIISDFGDGKAYVEEEAFWNTLAYVRNLIEQQRKALRTHDKQAIIACKGKEDALLARIQNYEQYRNQVSNLIK